MCFELLFAPDAEKVTEQPGVVEVEFRGLEEALIEVAEVRADKKDDGACLQDGKPRLGGVVDDAALPRQRREVDELPGPPGAQAKEALEGGEVADVEYRAYIALKVGRGVVGEPCGLPLSGVQRRITAGQSLRRRFREQQALRSSSKRRSTGAVCRQGSV